ncbi:MAG: hypothetical protein WCF24_12230 [Acidimicrobiales bacterium]
MTTEAPDFSDAHQRKPPPVAQLCVLSMALVIAGGILLAARLPRHVPIGPSLGLLIAAGALLVANVILISRFRPFAWKSFFLVGRWTSLAYLVIAGMLEFIFVFDHIRGSTLVLITFSLLVFAIDIPLLLSFSVARYQEPSAG